MSSQAARVYTVMRSLWDDVFHRQWRSQHPQPLGYVPELSMLVYVPAEGQFLDQVILDGDALRYMHLAAVWLGTLHRARLPLERHFQIAVELVNLQAWAALIGHHYPQEAEAATAISRHLQDSAGALELALDVPMHKDFHYGHIIADQGLKIIDFDEMRLGDPNFDLAHFCANLHLLAYRKTGVPTAFSAPRVSFSRPTPGTPAGRQPVLRLLLCLHLSEDRQAALHPARAAPAPRRGGVRPPGPVDARTGAGSTAHDPPRELSGKFATLTMAALRLQPPRPASRRVSVFARSVPPAASAEA